MSNTGRMAAELYFAKQSPRGHVVIGPLAADPRVGPFFYVINGPGMAHMAHVAVAESLGEAVGEFERLAFIERLAEFDGIENIHVSTTGMKMVELAEQFWPDGKETWDLLRKPAEIHDNALKLAELAVMPIAGRA